MRQFFNRHNNKNGFTLIELIVVIAILGILAVLAIPRFSDLQYSANKKAILGNLKMLDNAAMVYAADNDLNLSGVADNADPGGQLSVLVPTWPVGPKATTTYAVVGGQAQATLSADLLGVPATGGTPYTQSSAVLQ